MKILYHGHLWSGSTARHRFEAFGRLPGVTAIPSDAGAELGRKPSLWSRIRWKLRWPMDVDGVNAKLLRDVQAHRPDVVFVDNSRTMARRTLREIKQICDPLLVFYSPDDIVAPHNLSWPLRWSFPDWDVFFTTKTFNVEELRTRGVRNPVLVGNAFDPQMHRPMTPEEVGEDFERYDLVFVGTVEQDRMASILKLAEAGFTVAVFGNPASRRGAAWQGLKHPKILSGPHVSGLDYTRMLHRGKVALCFLRKMNRDQITTRSIECPAMARPMLAEKTAEHDSHFIDGEEYIGFSNDAEMIEKVRRLLADPKFRARVARQGFARSISSGYSTDSRAAQMMSAIKAGLNQRQ